MVPLEKVNTGELRLQIEAVQVNDSEGSRGSMSGSSNVGLNLFLLKAKDLIAADLRGTSDPYVRVHYGSLKKRTKCVVMYKTLNPHWNQTLEFRDDGSPLELHMKQLMIKFQSLIEEGNLEGLSTALSEMQSLEDMQEEYMVQIETEQMLLLNKIKELGQEIMSSSSSLSRRSSGF
ncbi:hypothetical protein D5086_023166 [Populus alba]|uniref:Uncharacterized protein n=1 Tax=Populus alba TaxID=43335 RepID=A0ACC4B9P3_POPAL